MTNFDNIHQNELVYIEWNDAYALNAWTEIGGVFEQSGIVHTAGFFLGEKDDYVAVAATLDASQGSAVAVQAIPVANVVKVTKLRTDE